MPNNDLRLYQVPSDVDKNDVRLYDTTLAGGASGITVSGTSKLGTTARSVTSKNAVASGQSKVGVKSSGSTAKQAFASGVSNAGIKSNASAVKNAQASGRSALGVTSASQTSKSAQVNGVSNCGVGGAAQTTNTPPVVAGPYTVNSSIDEVFAVDYGDEKRKRPKLPARPRKLNDEKAAIKHAFASGISRCGVSCSAKTKVGKAVELLVTMGLVRSKTPATGRCLVRSKPEFLQLKRSYRDVETI